MFKKLFAFLFSKKSDQPLSNQPANTSPAPKPNLKEKAKLLRLETLGRLKETAHDAATTEIIIDKVKRAALLFEDEGPFCFAQFKGRNSKFLDHGTYIYIIRMDGVMILHPLFPQLETTNVLQLYDSGGQLTIQYLLSQAQHSKRGWCTYYCWPEVGSEKRLEEKKIYFEKVTYGVRDFLVCCGNYM